MSRPQNINHDVGTRLQALALVEHGVQPKDVEKKTGISVSQISRLRKKARERGFQPEQSSVLRLELVIDAPRSGRPPKLTPDVEAQIVAQVTKNRFNRERAAASIGVDFDLCAGTILKALKKNHFKPCKTTKKPGLEEWQKELRLQFCLRVQNWTLEDWKNVIWTDETSVVLNQRRGKIRVWRRSNEQFTQSNIRRRWKGACEFMWWSCFSYDKKGPYHVWKPETKAEKKKAEEELKALNDRNEPELKAEWELQTGMRRMGLRNKGGPKPQWRFTKETGKIVRESQKGGIDWYRYQKKILIPKLIPFAQECKKERPGTLVQEDKAPAHASKHQEVVFSLADVMRLIWCGNSPDLNAIEPAWPWMKRKTTAKGPLRNRLQAERAWIKRWKKLPQRKIQEWIERIPRHVQEIIRCGGGNEYREGRSGGVIRPYNGEERRHAYQVARGVVVASDDSD